jgi:hypothetical protein
MSVLDSRDSSLGRSAAGFSASGTADSVIKPRPVGMRFLAEMDIAEVDERGRPGGASIAKGKELSRANVVISSRKLIYPGRMVALAVHLIDDRPVPLIGQVFSCIYDSDGLYRIDIDLLPMDDCGPVREWVNSRERNPAPRRSA